MENTEHDILRDPKEPILIIQMYTAANLSSIQSAFPNLMDEIVLPAIEEQCQMRHTKAIIIHQDAISCALVRTTELCAVMLSLDVSFIQILIWKCPNTTKLKTFSWQR